MHHASKIIEKGELQQEIARLKQRGSRIVFTNGCFDILHAGHVRYLTAARALGHVLVVGLNSDDSVRAIKGSKRPIVCQAQRAEVLAGLGCVDFVIFFDEPDPLTLIKALTPDILVKGDDWPEEAIVGAEAVRSGGGRVVRIPLAREVSTSRIIAEIVRRYA